MQVAPTATSFTCSHNNIMMRACARMQLFNGLRVVYYYTLHDTRINLNHCVQPSLQTIKPVSFPYLQRNNLNKQTLLQIYDLFYIIFDYPNYILLLHIIYTEKY